MTTKQKAKGKYFESKIAEHIRNTLNLRENECVRSPNSGNGEFEFGDLFFTDPVKYPYVFECKFGYEWDLKALFPKLNKQLSKFLKQNQEAVDKYKKKMNMEPRFSGVILSKPYFDPILLTNFYECDLIETTRIVTEDEDGNRVFVYPLNEGLKILFELQEDPLYAR